MSKESKDRALAFAVSSEKVVSPTEVQLTLAGYLDAEGAPVLSDVLAQKLEAGVRHVVLDFANIQFISSTGIGTLIAAIGEYRDVGGDVIVKKLSTELREVFEMLDLLDYVTVG